MGFVRNVDRVLRWGGFAAGVLVLALAPGCTSVLWVDRAGDPHLVGLGTMRPVVAEGGVVTHVSMPGLGLRVVPDATGYSLGHRETTLYFGDSTADGRPLLAVGDAAWGLALDVGSVVIGAQRRFVILAPSEGTNVIQEIHYESGPPASSWLRRREVE